jgi:hypothetical protein
MSRDVIAKFFIIACNYNYKIVKGHYFKKLSRDNATNYALFEKFVRECSSSLLCSMHSDGFCNGDVTLENIIRRLVETRHASKAYFENDAGGFIANFLRQAENREQREGKLIKI